MKLAYSTNAFRSMSIDDTIAVLADAGYDGVELMADTPHAWPPETGRSELEAMQTAMDRHGLAWSNINAFMMVAIDSFHHPSWIEADANKRQLRIEHTNACLRMARDLGIPRISTEPGGPLDGMSEAEATPLFAESLAPCLAVAEECEVRLLIEPEPDLLIETSSQMLRFLEQHPHPWQGINFDIGHFYCVGEDPAELIRTFGDKVEHVHLEDIAANREHVHLLPGTGAIDFDDVFSALNEIRYDGWITIELYPYDDDPAKTAREAHDIVRPWVEAATVS
jgi:sugar phosphate isomerase/epimerase